MDLTRNLAYPSLLCIALIAGLALPFQAGINGTLRGYLGHPLRASLGNFAVGTLVLLVVTMFIRQPWPALSSLARGPWWMWVGGLLGGIYVFSAILVLPRLGASVTFAVIVAGQMAASLCIDRFGLFGITPAAISPVRIAGAVLIVLAVYLIQR